MENKKDSEICSLILENEKLEKQLSQKNKLIEEAIEELEYWMNMCFLRNDLNDHDYITVANATKEFISKLKQSKEKENE